MITFPRAPHLEGDHDLQEPHGLYLQGRPRSLLRTRVENASGLLGIKVFLLYRDNNSSRADEGAVKEGMKVA